MIRRLVIARMDAWHNGPHGGRCPRVDGPQCSRYGAAAVARYGAVAGLIAAARYVATCSVGDEKWYPPDEGCLRVDDGGCWSPSYPRRWDLLALLLVGVLYRENPGDPVLPQPCGPPKTLRVLVMFARIAVTSHGPGVPDDDGCKP